MNFKGSVLRITAVLAAPVLSLCLGCDGKGVKETRSAAVMAVKDIQNRVDDATEAGLAERARGRSEEPLDWPALASTAVMQFQASAAAKSQMNPYDPGKPLFVSKTASDQPGTVFLDVTPAASGAILVTAVFKDDGRVKRETLNVKLNLSLRPKKIDVDSGAMPAAPNPF